MKPTGYSQSKWGWRPAVATVLLWACGWAWGGSYDDFMQALRHDRVDVIRQLAPRGFDLNTPDADLNPPLVVALKAESLKVAQYLVAQPGVDLDATNPAGENALMLAALNGQVSLMKVLIQQGAEVNKTGWTPLHYAATHSGPASAEMVTLLLEHHAYIDAESPNKSTPLMMAARYGDEKVVALLLAEGADAMPRNERGMNALDFAQSAGRQSLADMIAKSMNTKAPTGSW